MMSASEQPNAEEQRGPEEDQSRRFVVQLSDGGQEVPLFLRGISDGRKGNAQDERDEDEE